jgi:ferredoxin-NADP reductase
MDRSEIDQQAITPAARFRRFSVVDKQHENDIICSFLLKPEDPDDWCTFQAGQFLSLKIRRGENRPILRNYSVSSDPATVGTYRITVKRESAPRPGVPDGLGSSYLHDEVKIGSSLEIAGPRGHFYLDATSNRPLLLLSGGVGLTPMVSMLHVAARQKDRPIWFIHACRDGASQALADEIQAVAATNPNIKYHVVYQTPTREDRLAARFQSEGFIDLACLQALLPPADYECYLCGPPPFMQSVYDTLRSLDIPNENIAYEFFGPATVLDKKSA